MIVGVTGNQLALVGLITTAIVGVVGPVMTWLVAKQNRQHERAIAHDARLYEHRSEIYVELLADVRREISVLYRIAQWARAVTEESGSERTLELPGQDETNKMRARVAAFGSQEMVDLVDEFKRAGQRAFLNAEQKRKRLIDDDADPEDLEEHLQTMEQIPGHAADVLPRMEARARDELTELNAPRGFFPRRFFP